MSLEDYLVYSFECLISRHATIAVGGSRVVVMFNGLCVSYIFGTEQASVLTGEDHLDICGLLESLVKLHNVKYPSNEN